MPPTTTTAIPLNPHLQSMDVEDDHTCRPPSGQGDVGDDAGQGEGSGHIAFCLDLQRRVAARVWIASRDSKRGKRHGRAHTPALPEGALKGSQLGMHITGRCWWAVPAMGPELCRSDTPCWAALQHAGCGGLQRRGRLQLMGPGRGRTSWWGAAGEC